jgi:hypothetical protein
MIKCFVCYIEFVGINKKDDEVHFEKNGWDTFTILCSISSPLSDWKMCMDICNLKYGTNRKSLFWVGINNICSHILLSVAFFFLYGWWQFIGGSLNSPPLHTCENSSESEGWFGQIVIPCILFMIITWYYCRYKYALFAGNANGWKKRRSF